MSSFMAPEVAGKKQAIGLVSITTLRASRSASASLRAVLILEMRAVMSPLMGSSECGEGASEFVTGCCYFAKLAAWRVLVVWLKAMLLGGCEQHDD